MALGSSELYDLFLALGPARLTSARRALLELPGAARTRELQATLVPLAVDATLLGAHGLSALANAAAHAEHADLTELEAAVSELERAIAELGHGDASGARVNEAELLARARSLTETSRGGVARVLDADENRGPETRASRAPRRNDLGADESPKAAAAEDSELSQVEHWQPTLTEDMLGAFLDECAERTEGLSARLLELEERGHDPELVAEIFRDLHTLKGSSGFAGLKKLNKIAHVAEDLIGQLRSGEVQPERGLIDVLLETLEAVRLILDRARAREPIEIDVTDLVARLRDPTRRRAPAAAQVTPGASPAGVPSPTAGALVAAPTTATPTSGAPTTGAPTTGAALATNPARPAAAQATLRIDFEKVDLLLNLVGEIVLSRGQLAAGQDSQSQVLRELAGFRNRLAETLASFESSGSLSRTGTQARARRTLAWPANSSQSLLEDLQRVERVLAEGFGELETNLNRLRLAVAQLRDTVLKLRMVPIARLFSKYQRTVRDLSQKLGKRVRVVLHGAETELDKVLVERLEDPLLHLVRNAVDHGIEPPSERRAAHKPEEGELLLSAVQRGGQIVVVIKDDGRGLDPERLKAKAVERGLLSPAEARELLDDRAFDLIFQPGFSTAAQVSDVSGRGVGMDVVRSAIERLKGSVILRSKLGQGTEVELCLPLTLAITQVLAVRVAGELLALPLDAVVSAQTLEASQVEFVAGEGCVRIADELIPLTDLGACLGLNQGPEQELQGSVIVVQVGAEELGLVVQQVVGRHEVVIKSLGPLLANVSCAAGATLIGDRMALVVDLVGVAARLHQPSLEAAPVARAPRGEPVTRGHILVAEDSDAMRESLERDLTRAGFRVTGASDGREALALAQKTQFDAVCTDIMMPNLDGYQLIRALRELPQYRGVPIVVLSSKGARIDSMRGFDAGADAYLNKPADAAELTRELETLLARRRS